MSAAMDLRARLAPLTLAEFALCVARVGNGPNAANAWLKHRDRIRLADRPAAWAMLVERTAEVMRGHKELTHGISKWLRARCAFALAERIAKVAPTALVVVRDGAGEFVDDAVDAIGEALQGRILDMERPEDLADVVAAIEASGLAQGFKRALSRAAREHAATLGQRERGE